MPPADAARPLVGGGGAAAHTTPDGPKAQFGSTAFFFYCRAGRAAALSFPRRENQPGFAVRRMVPRSELKKKKEKQGDTPGRGLVFLE